MDPPKKQAKTEKEPLPEKQKGTEFFASLKLASSDHLDEAQKGKCERCGRTMKYYCYDCVARMDARTPTVTLPIALDIIHHPSEKLSKSTAIHAVVLSDQAKMHESPNVPDYDPETTVLLFPSATAVDILDYPKLSTLKRVVVVDSQWQKTNGIISHPNLAKLPCVVISKRSTYFWRYQPKDMGDDFLATIEAIYYFYRDYMTAVAPDGTEYDGSVDNLLYFFGHMYGVIQKSYKKQGKEMSKISNFVEKDE